MIAPDTAAIRMAMPSSRATPTPSSPIMKAQSAAGPDRPAKRSWKTLPSVAKLRKPKVGEPPVIQASAPAVAIPRPKVLSRKAHRKIQASARRASAMT